LAAGTGLLALGLAVWKPLCEAEPDLTPSMHWPEPALHADSAVDAADVPVLVRIDYVIAHEQRAEFLTRVRELAQERRRDGAVRWTLVEDAEHAGHFSEFFEEPSWAEHRRHHHRVTQADAALQARVHELHSGSTPPRVTHALVRRG
jgi:hypothetical protein